ncbi:pirin family protein [Enhygromyxa salina]|uniref:Quercetin 2,3-dioxygenase n=1 Tax=Enhygromyxa salina TaxID=215803 RepID=A0A2S9Y3F2_9BACT|nr:pirin family protein [Enhygromyxa salina]PRP99637.1 Quercetin 2,3-dioxygenase [Enhygromyxa salina]
MSTQPANSPECKTTPTHEIETIIDGKPRDIDGFSVRRILPSAARRAVGPFVFFDHMGPAKLEPGRGLDVRPHPHINLATVTYLFDGEIVHRDSLGTHQPIRPGAINWMTAGRGIVHSERTSAEARAQGPQLHGIQLWVALPAQFEEVEPEFHHHGADTLPEVERGGARLRVLAGSAFGVTSPVHVFSPLFYVEAIMPAGSEVELPTGHPDRAAYIAEGSVSCGAEPAEAGRMLIYAAGTSPRLTAITDARVMLLGGAPLEGQRHIWWNFVSSNRERIEQAKQDWAEGRFPKVPGDEDEFIPLPA